MDTLHTQRLILRPLAPSDSTDLFAARCDEEVMEFWDGPPDAIPSETAAIVDLLLADVQSGTAKYWAIVLRQDDSFIGVCDLSEIRESVSSDLGFMLLRKFWGFGFGREVVRCLLTYAKSLGLKSVTARIHSENARSRILLLRTGFQLVEEVRRYEIRPGLFRDCLRFETRLLDV
jgi:ribosomal-protein-alanine N-acetyltransferase